MTSQKSLNITLWMVVALILLFINPVVFGIILIWIALVIALYWTVTLWLFPTRRF